MHLLLQLGHSYIIIACHILNWIIIVWGVLFQKPPVHTQMKVSD